MISALRWAVMGAILMLHSLWGTKSQYSIHRPQLYRGPSAYQPNALPLGQTSSRQLMWFARRGYSSVIQHRGHDDDEVMLNVLRCQLTYYRQAVTNAEAWFNIALRPRKPEGSLGQTAQDGHLDSHTAPELCWGHDLKVVGLIPGQVRWENFNFLCLLRHPSIAYLSGMLEGCGT